MVQDRLLNFEQPKKFLFWSRPKLRQVSDTLSTGITVTALVAYPLCIRNSRSVDLIGGGAVAQPVNTMAISASANFMLDL